MTWGVSDIHVFESAPNITLFKLQTLLAQHVAGNSEPELVYSAIFAPTDDELFDVMVIIPLDGRAIYIEYYPVVVSETIHNLNLQPSRVLL